MSCGAKLTIRKHVKQREIGFATAFANRDKAKFASFIAPDATFFAGARPIAGRDQVVKEWNGFLSSEKPPFSWTPLVVVVKPSNDVAISLGPIFDENGKETGRYSSIWQKQASGEWLIVFDGRPGLTALWAAEIRFQVAG